MKQLLTILVVSSLISVAIFGVLAMSHSSDGHGGCLAATSQTAECPDGNRTLGFIAFHFDALKNFSNAVFNEDITLAFSLLALFLILTLSAKFLSDFSFYQLLAFSPAQKYRLNEFKSPLKQAAVRWLSLHENSPSSF